MLRLCSSWRETKEIALEFRQASVQQLAFLGHDSAVPGLMKLLKEKPEAYHWSSHGYRLNISETIVRILDLEQKDCESIHQYLGDNDKTFAKWVDEKKADLDYKLAELKSLQTGEPMPKKKGKKRKKAKKESKQALTKKQKMVHCS